MTHFPRKDLFSYESDLTPPDTLMGAGQTPLPGEHTAGNDAYAQPSEEGLLQRLLGSEHLVPFIVGVGAAAVYGFFWAAPRDELKDYLERRRQD